MYSGGMAINHCMGGRGTTLGGCRVAARSGVPALTTPVQQAPTFQGGFDPDLKRDHVTELLAAGEVIRTYKVTPGYR